MIIYIIYIIYIRYNRGVKKENKNKIFNAKKPQTKFVLRKNSQTKYLTKNIIN